jgi:hypothetical protein
MVACGRAEVKRVALVTTSRFRFCLCPGNVVDAVHRLAENNAGAEGFLAKRSGDKKRAGVTKQGVSASVLTLILVDL